MQASTDFTSQVTTTWRAVFTENVMAATCASVNMYQCGVGASSHHTGDCFKIQFLTLHGKTSTMVLIHSVS
eukprot:scaffold682662_cov64-Prasinocladus_malaysianus.AAC.1